jgi:hypothetical protein
MVVPILLHHPNRCQPTDLSANLALHDTSTYCLPMTIQLHQLTLLNVVE